MANVKDRTKEVMERLEKGIQNVFSNGSYESYLKTTAKFHNYSYNNTMLIYLQKPDATLIAGYGSWKNNFKRQVQKGEKGIQILAPAFYKEKVEMEKIDLMTKKPILNTSGEPVTELVEIEKPYFKPVNVFDISQTAGEPLPELAPELKANVENFEVFYNSLQKVSPFPIEIKKITSGAKGYCDITNQRIAIKQGLSEAQTIKTGIHEIAHAMLHSSKEAFENTDSRTKEVEAESIAFIVSEHFGIDTSTYSFGYIASWSATKELNELKSSLNVIQKTTNTLIKNIESAYKELQIQKERDLAVSLEDGEIDINREKEPSNKINSSITGRIEVAKLQAESLKKEFKSTEKESKNKEYAR